MKVIKSGDMYKATRISGPKHNYLGLELSTSQVQAPRVTYSRIEGDSESIGVIERSKLLSAVQSGVRNGNQGAGTSYSVRRIDYVASDTPDYNVYSELATAIVMAAAAE